MRMGNSLTWAWVGLGSPEGVSSLRLCRGRTEMVFSASSSNGGAEQILHQYTTAACHPCHSCLPSLVLLHITIALRRSFLGLSFRPTERQTSKQKKRMPVSKEIVDVGPSCVRRLIDSSSFTPLLFNPVSLQGIPEINHGPRPV